MQSFLETVSVTGAIAVAIVTAIVVLTLFYRGLDWLGRGDSLDKISMRGVTKQGTRATVYVAGRKPFEHVRIVGVTDSREMKSNLPWELSGMVVLEDELATRFVVRAKDIKMIVVPSNGDRSPPTASDSAQ